jgi:dTDP-4-dehydrorhamnose 3,5-epimerase
VRRKSSGTLTGITGAFPALLCAWGSWRGTQATGWGQGRDEGRGGRSQPCGHGMVRRAGAPTPRPGAHKLALADSPGTSEQRQGRLLKVNPVPRIAGALLFEPVPYTDERGFFSRTFDSHVARDAGINPAGFVQDSQSRSVCGVVRGLHMRGGAGEAKLVRCSYGAIFDVIVDLRYGSPTYLNWESFELRDTEQVSLYVPAGCAHGFQALTEPADVSYRIDRAHNPAEDISIAFDDPEIAIPWPLPVTAMSPRDRAAQPLAAALKLLKEANSPLPVAAP